VTLASLKKIFRTPILNRRSEGSVVERIGQTIGMRYSSIDQEVQYLSGGNQQKVVIAKWLCSESEFLIVNEPTRGIDLGARYDIYQVLLDLSASGTAILLISSEFKELIGICDRIAVIHNGNIVQKIEDFSGLTEEKLLVYASGNNSNSNQASSLT
jgi:ABC-type sugar transport system ATPase subunit